MIYRNLRDILILVVFFCFLFVGGSVCAAVSLSTIQINYKGPKEFKNQLNHLIPYTKGQQVELDSLTEHLELIKQRAQFKEFDYELIKEAKDKYFLKVNIIKCKKVRKIGVTGNYPLLAKSIKKIIPLQPGSDFDQELVPNAIHAIKDYLEKNGFYDAGVIIKAKETTDFDVVDLSVKIKRGTMYRVNQISIVGTKYIDEKMVRNKISRYSRFKIKRLKNDIKSIKRMYAKQGFIKARVNVEGIVFHHKEKKVDLYLKVRENKKFTLKITGKTYFNKERLKAVTKLKELRSYDRYAIKKGKERLERYYRYKGFPDAQIKSEIIKPDKHSVVAIYNIVTGTRVDLKRIVFKGNDELGDRKLKKAIKSKESAFMNRQFYHQDKLFADRFLLEEEYARYGFFEASVSEPNTLVNDFGDQKTVTFKVEEGPEYLLQNIVLESDLPLDTTFLLKESGLKAGKKFRDEKIQKAKNKVLDTLFLQGFAYADLTPQITLNNETKQVDLKFVIKRGRKVKVRSVVVDGNLITKENAIRKNLKIKEGELFVYQKMLDGQLNLRRLGAFSSVRITPVGFENKKQEIDLLITLVERKTIVMNVSGGFDSRHLATGEFNFTKYNLFGSGRQFNTRVIGGPEYDRIEATFYSPRIFGASWNLSVQGFGQYEDETYYTAASYGGFASTLKNFGPHWTFGFKEQVSRTEVFESESDVATLGDSLFDNTFNEFQMSVLLDLRDNFSDPQKGVYVLVQNELNTDLSDVKNNFNTFRFNMNHYFGFFRRFTLVNTLRYGHTFELASQPRIPVNKLFFLGGADTLRGFAEDGIDPSGGTIIFIYNGELQFRLTDSIKVAGFFDAGVIGDSIDTISTNDFRESAGFGFRYFTPIGPIRLDWGFILDRQGNEPSNRVHFSFGYYF